MTGVNRVQDGVCDITGPNRVFTFYSSETPLPVLRPSRLSKGGTVGGGTGETCLLSLSFGCGSDARKILRTLKTSLQDKRIVLSGFRVVGKFHRTV